MANRGRKNRLDIRLNDREFLALKRLASQQGVRQSEAVRDWLKNLPTYPANESIEDVEKELEQ